MTDLSPEQQQIYDYIVKMLKKKHAVLNQEKSGIPYYCGTITKVKYFLST